VKSHPVESSAKLKSIYVVQLDKKSSSRVQLGEYQKEACSRQESCCKKKVKFKVAAKKG